MKLVGEANRLGHLLLAAALLITVAIYWPGLHGSWLFDDYPNIVENKGVQPNQVEVATLVNAALSSPSSEFKRPLASLSFAINYLFGGLDPYRMKLTNLVIHLLNGSLVFLLAKVLLRSNEEIGSQAMRLAASRAGIAHQRVPTTGESPFLDTEKLPCSGERHLGVVAALIATGWMLLPINLTGVLYVVQRMESMANLFVLLGLLGYLAGRRRMLAASPAAGSPIGSGKGSWGFGLCLVSLILGTVTGILAKETAVMLPLYAFLIEWLLFGFRGRANSYANSVDPSGARSNATTIRRDRRVISLFVLLLALPIMLGLAWLLPSVMNPSSWASRDFTLGTRLLSESRIVSAYVAWTLMPTPSALSFYHDNFVVSTGLLSPWTTLAGITFLVSLLALGWWFRRRQRLFALGIALFFGCQLLTGTILPLELIYEHRNYFASFGLLLAIVPLLAAPSGSPVGAASAARPLRHSPNENIAAEVASTVAAGLPLALPRYALLAGLLLCWSVLTALTAYAWGNPLRLAEDLATRAPQSPRAEYELGRTYIIYSHYDPTSPFTKLAYAPLEKAAALPEASILPEQALIFMNSRMHLPLRDAWWDSMLAKLKAREPGVQDESSLGALTQCDREHHCDLPKQRMIQAYLAALSHPAPSARLLATYGDYAWNVLQDHDLGMRMTDAAVKTAPREPAYRITQIRMLVVKGQADAASNAIKQLQVLNIGGRLDASIRDLKERIDSLKSATATQTTAM